METIKAMTLVECLTILAIILGPIAAVQVTRILDGVKEKRTHKLIIFKTLMATRAQSTAWVHVEALNRIDLEFKNTGKEKAVVNEWRVYVDWLNKYVESPNQPEGQALQEWENKRQELLTNLLFQMAQVLGYDFDKVQIRKAAYVPRVYGNTELEQAALRFFGIEVLRGNRPILVQEHTPTPPKPDPRHLQNPLRPLPPR